MKKERNDRCDCGSGKKYKNCCLLEETQKQADERYQASSQKISTALITRPEIEKECDDALTSIEAGDLDSAKAVAKRLIGLYPHDSIVNYLQGVCAFREDHLTDALYYFEKSIRIDPLFSQAHFNLGCIFIDDCMIPKAVMSFRKVLEIEENESELSARAQEEIQWIEQMIQENHQLTLDQYLEADGIFQQAFACLKAKQHEEAIFLFQKVLTINPNNVQSYSNMALSQGALGNKSIALECIDKALAIDPAYEPAKKNRLIIEQLAENAKNNTEVKVVSYYRERLANKNVEVLS